MAKVWPGSVKHTAAPPVFIGSKSERKASDEHSRIAMKRHESKGSRYHDGSPHHHHPDGVLSSKERDEMPKEEFGEPGSRKYPMPDRSHAANAKARASQQESKGNLSEGEEANIDAKADRILHRGRK